MTLEQVSTSVWSIFCYYNSINEYAGAVANGVVA